MSLLSSKRFVVKVADSSEETARTSRRLIVNADIVKAAKLCTGDVIALSDYDNVKDLKVGPDGVCAVPFNNN
jgi:AAA family ATPase